MRTVLTTVFASTLFATGLVIAFVGLRSTPPVSNPVPRVTFELDKNEVFPDTVPFELGDDQRPFVWIFIDGKFLKALLDTGSSLTLIDSRYTGVPANGSTYLTDFHSGGGKYPTASLEVCVSTHCDTEDVAVVRNLSSPAVLRGSFFGRFSTVTWDYEKKQIILGGLK